LSTKINADVNITDLDDIRIESNGDHNILQITSELCTATVHCRGAQVLSFTPRGQRDLLWQANPACVQPDKALRGGIPICWPWFAAHPTQSDAPQHGLVRTAAWYLHSASTTVDGITLALKPQSLKRTLWPDGLDVSLQICLGSTLSLRLQSTNNSPSEILISDALHSYFSISDIAKVCVYGLEQSAYFDKASGKARPATGSILQPTGETDYVYNNAPSVSVMEDRAWARRIYIKRSFAASTIVWNPGKQKSQHIADLAADDYRHFLCVESGNVTEDSYHLASGEKSILAVDYRLESI
jgi:glucose-6-phosphate 1-epimerase